MFVRKVSWTAYLLRDKTHIVKRLIVLLQVSPTSKFFLTSPLYMLIEILYEELNIV